MQKVFGWNIGGGNALHLVAYSDRTPDKKEETRHHWRVFHSNQTQLQAACTLLYSAKRSSVSLELLRATVRVVLIRAFRASLLIPVDTGLIFAFVILYLLFFGDWPAHIVGSYFKWRLRNLHQSVKNCFKYEQVIRQPQQHVTS
jgi:hypothetical protein